MAETDVQKRLKALNKKLGQIAKLKDKASLSQEEAEKVALEASFLQEVEALKRGEPLREESRPKGKGADKPGKCKEEEEEEEAREQKDGKAGIGRGREASRAKGKGTAEGGKCNEEAPEQEGRVGAGQKKALHAKGKGIDTRAQGTGADNGGKFKEQEEAPEQKEGKPDKGRGKEASRAQAKGIDEGGKRNEDVAPEQEDGKAGTNQRKALHANGKGPGTGGMGKDEKAPEQEEGEADKAQRTKRWNAKGKGADIGGKGKEEREVASRQEVAPMTIAELHTFLRVGPVVEDEDRAARSRSESGAKGNRARVARETLQILEDMHYDSPSGGRVNLSRNLLQALGSSAFYPHTMPRSRPLGRPRFEGSTTTEVQICTTLSAAQSLAWNQAGCVPGVLNFASARNPGGGFSTGAEAQEESLARSSGLYPCLTKLFSEFFLPHRKAKSGKYTNAMIFSPAVPVIRDDQGQLLDSPYEVDFVTSAAPNMGVMWNSIGDKAVQECSDALRERSARVLHLFAEHGTVDLVLGAWGCGVFRNDPGTVASIFKQLLVGSFRGRFRRIIFAILDPEMARVFASTFGVKLPPKV